MDVSVAAFLVLLIVVALLRGVELVISRRHQRRLEAQGVSRASEPHFQWMVLLHTAVLAGAALEVLLLNRPLIPVLAIAMGTLVALANALRWWVIYTLGTHWNVQVMDSRGHWRSVSLCPSSESCGCVRRTGRVAAY